MNPDPVRPASDDGATDLDSETLPPVYPEEMAFPRARDD
jgi:hypothetical protein